MNEDEMAILKVLVESNQLNTHSQCEVNTDSLIETSGIHKNRLLVALKGLYSKGYLKDYNEGGNAIASVFVCLSNEGIKAVRG